jgi:putative adenylate-forming enzyme
MNIGLAHAAVAFWRTRRLASTLRDRDGVLRWRDAQLRRFLQRSVPRVGYYAGLRPRALDELPVLDKAAVLANFDKLNTRGVTLEAARAALDGGRDRVGGLNVGQSTGTSGNRGVYVISEAERFTWLGVIMAKTVPDFPAVKRKVALVLPSFSSLYRSAAATGRLSLRFFDLALGEEGWRDSLMAFAPDVVVAPPKVLRALAERGDLTPDLVFSGAEVLDPLDREVIEAGFGVKVREIYMATEGLFGVGCAHGTLHLAEDAVAFEWEPQASSDLVAPIVTDFTRRTQIMARYRMNDLLRLSREPCACGSPLQAVAAVEGRCDDVFLLPGERGRVMITPDVVRNAVVDADRRILDYRVVQTGPDTVEVALDEALPPEAGEAALASLSAALMRARAGAVELRLRPGLLTPFDRKLRRIRRDWRPPEA